MAEDLEDRELRALVARATPALKVFPLPGVVVLPGTPTPFHVFEPRYREMTGAALDGDRCLAIATLRQPEQALEDRPPLHPVAGAGVIEADERLADGRYHILFRCLARVRLAEEVRNGLGYREFRAELMDDVWPVRGAAALEHEVEVLGQLVYDLARVLPAESGASKFAEVAARTRDASRLADLVAAAVVTDPAARYRILEEVVVARRIAAVAEEVASVLLVLGGGRASRA